MPTNQIAESQLLVQLADQDQAGIGSDARAVEVNLQGVIEGRLKRPILFLTHWVEASASQIALKAA
jgi:hypothetical protein